MSFAIDLKEYGSDLKKSYESVVSSDPETTWAVFDYAASDNVLKPSADGPGDLDDFVDAFDDAKVQYGLAQVEFNSINKVVLVGWVGENVPSRQRLVFNAHMSAVAKQFPGHHVQITARSNDELTPSIILERVSAAAGSKYAAATKPAPSTKPAYVTAKDGANEDDWGDAQNVEERELQSGNGSGYRSSVRDELEQLRKGKKSHTPEKKVSAPKVEEDDEDEKQNGISGLDSGTSYKPVGKIDLKAIREAGKNSKFADARIEKIESSYKPVGKVDLKAIREQARKEKEMKSRKEESEAPTPRSPPAKASSKRDVPKKDESEEEDEKESEPARNQSRLSRSKVASNTDDDDEPQLGSLSDRMKAFQASIGAAKPKYDTSSSRPSTRSSAPISRKISSTSNDLAKADSTKADSTKAGSEDEDEEAPISVAAQLAKARLGGEKKDDSPSLPQRDVKKEYGIKSTPKATESDDEDEAPKGNVSTFAARFAAKSSSNGSESKSSTERAAPAKAPEPAKSNKDEFDEEDVPAAPKRPGAASSKSAPEPEPELDSKQNIEDDEDHADKGLVGVVVFEHEKEDDDEISLKVGEKITEIQEVDENWFLGRNPAGDVGLFPAEFVDIEGKKSGNGSSKSASSGKSESPATNTKVAIAQFSYEAGDEDELEFEENEEIVEIEFPSEDWWSGKNSKGEYGLFPASYVTLQ